MRDGWIETTVSHLLECSIGGVWGSDPGTSEVDVCVYRQTEFDDDGKLTMPSEAIRSMTRSQLKSRALQPGDVLMQKSAGTPSLPGRVVRVRDGIENDSTCSNFLQLLRADQSVCNSDYLFWLLWMGHRTGRAFEFQRGTNIRNLDLNQYLIQPVLLPPLQEQKRIVDVVSAVDEYIAALQRQADAARTARNAVLRELLTAGGDDWTETTLEQLFKIVPGKYIAKSEYVEDGPFWIYGSNSVMGKYSKALISEPHVVMAAIGAYAGAVRFSAEPSWVNNNAFGIVPNSKVEPFFLYLWLAQVLELNQILAGTGQPYVRRPALSEQQIALPPLPEQKRICELVMSMDVAITSTQETAACAKPLRSALLADLLSGDHEIPDSYDHLLGVA